MDIPADADLSAERCDESFRMAEQFFAEYFPETAGSKFACDSWLLSPALKELLPEESRILQFQNRFEVKSWNKEEDAYLEWVFKRKDLPLEKLPEETSLQRKMKAYVLQLSLIHILAENEQMVEYGQPLIKIRRE